MVYEDKEIPVKGEKKQNSQWWLLWVIREREKEEKTKLLSQWWFLLTSTWSGRSRGGKGEKYLHVVYSWSEAHGEAEDGEGGCLWTEVQKNPLILKAFNEETWHQKHWLHGIKNRASYNNKIRMRRKKNKNTKEEGRKNVLQPFDTTPLRLQSTTWPHSADWMYTFRTRFPPVLFFEFWLPSEEKIKIKTGKSGGGMGSSRRSSKKNRISLWLLLHGSR